MHKLALVLVCFSYVGHGRRRVVGTVPLASESKSVRPKTRGLSASSDEFSALLLAASPATRLARPTFGVSQSETHMRRLHKDQRPMMMDDQRIQAYEWMANLGAPSALVAGAALASLYELHSDMIPDEKDKPWVLVAKKAGNLLFLSAFAFEIACVFVTTVTGTLLLGKGVANPVASSAMFMLDRELEFEYLSSRVFFFQGLLHWLSGVAIHQMIPEENATSAGTKIRKSHSWALFSLIGYMLAYYNKHISFYANYGVMLLRLMHLTYHRFYADKFRVLPALALIPLILSIKNMWSSFRDVSGKRKAKA